MQDSQVSEEEQNPAMQVASSVYLAVARAPSVRTSVAARKLLILDLNGTLLLRPKPRSQRNRPIYPRPFMPVFRSFLFHHAVKPWLDVRVWSSAQPHNVENMVERCFAERRHELNAVWARDTLGLTMDEYMRKVETTKDLERHWSAELGAYKHSARTTLLLDDSSLKAKLQPYNHLCIPEYTPNLRNRDRGAKEKLAKREIQTRSRDILRSAFDRTLIAVIGVLDEVRQQTNVAGWIRAGGLWAERGPPSENEKLSLELFSDSDTEQSDASRSRKVSPSPGNDAEDGEDAPMWFDHQPCFDYWVDRGTQALEELEINLEHGIDE